MRKLAWPLLLALTFSIPWEYSLDLGPPLGNIARVLALALLLCIVPAVIQAGHVRSLPALHWLALALYCWFALTFVWSIDPQTTASHLRGYFQEMMIVWFVWELAESPRDLRNLLRCYVAGSSVLALLTITNFVSADAAGQIRFVAEGQDPNDVARFLDLGFPLGALLLSAEERWPGKLLALGYLPLGLIGVLLTASRGGLIAATVALAGCAFVLVRSRSRAASAAALFLPLLLLVMWGVIPQGTIDRLATIPQQLAGGDLNQRLNIWAAGWQAFVHAPFAGSGAGTFVSAAGLAPIDTAHNTALAIAVEGGVVALLLASGIVAAVVVSLLAVRGSARMALGTAFAVWLVTSLVATVQENRTTWLLLGMIAVAGRLAAEQPEELARVCPESLPVDLRKAAAVSLE
jgi:O-antigen ligase